jgi:hypothetical protein
MVHPSVGLCPPPALSYLLFINLLHSKTCASSHIVKLRIEHDIYALSTRSSFQGWVKAQTQLLYQSQSFKTMHFVAQSNPKMLALSYQDFAQQASLLSYILTYLYFYNLLQKGLIMGKPHGPTSQNPLQKP